MLYEVVNRPADSPINEHPNLDHDELIVVPY
jgi:hypothetical protein